MEGGGGHFPAEGTAQLEEVEDLVAVVVLEGGGEAEVATTGGDEAAHGGQLALEAVLFAADGVVLGAEAFEGDADLDVRMLLDNALELVGLEAVGGDFELTGLGVEEVDDLLDVGAEGGFAAREVEVIETGRELGEGGGADLFGGQGGVLPDMTHGTA